MGKMKQIVHNVIGYRVGKTALTYLLRPLSCVLHEKSSLKPIFLNQACSVKIAGYWPPSLFKGLLSIHKHA